MIRIVIFVLLLCCSAALARDKDGRYAQSNPKLHEWFESLHSGKGPCCSDADGTALSDVDWESQDKPNSHFKVRIDGKWVDVPDDAVLKQPNMYGQTMVWPYYEHSYYNGGETKIIIRCFILGAGI